MVVKTFTVTLTPQKEVPPNSSTGSGVATITLDTTANTLAASITFSGMSGPVTGAHIHGFASTNSTAPILFTYPQTPPPPPYTSPITGTWTYTEDQEDEILAGLTYINLHTTANSGGEIRGQITVPSSCWRLPSCDVWGGWGGWGWRPAMRDWVLFILILLLLLVLVLVWFR